jgi:hypothetical protein
VLAPPLSTTPDSDAAPFVPSLEEATKTINQSPTEAVTVDPVTTVVFSVVLTPLAKSDIVAAISLFYH